MKRSSWLSCTLALSTYITLWSAPAQPIISLHEIDRTQLTPLKTTRDEHGEQATVYQNKNEQTYYKLWSEKYAYGEHFLNAMNTGFYDGITCLIGIIFDENGHCRGYVTQTASTTRSRLVYDKFKRGRSICTAIAPVHKQTDPAYKVFYAQLLTAIENTGYVFFDLAPSNVVLVDDHYALIDLNSVAPLATLDNAFIATLYPTDYRTFIQNLKQKDMHNEE